MAGKKNLNFLNTLIKINLYNRKLIFEIESNHFCLTFQRACTYKNANVRHVKSKQIELTRCVPLVPNTTLMSLKVPIEFSNEFKPPCFPKPKWNFRHYQRNSSSLFRRRRYLLSSTVVVCTLNIFYKKQIML